MMKTLYMIGGTMGIGKTTVCQQLKQDLPNSLNVKLNILNFVHLTIISL